MLAYTNLNIKRDVSTPYLLPDESEGRQPSITATPSASRPNGGANTSYPSAPAQRIRRRNRMITSCLECRRRKLKCDKSHPCTNCSKFARDCVFLAPALDSASQLKLTEIKEKMGSLERVLEQDVARKAGSRRGVLPESGDQDDADLVFEPDDEKDLEPTPLAVVDAAYDDDADNDLLDLGIKMGKLRLTERVGGFFRPKVSEEVSNHPIFRIHVISKTTCFCLTYSRLVSRWVMYETTIERQRRKQRRQNQLSQTYLLRLLS